MKTSLMILLLMTVNLLQAQPKTEVSGKLLGFDGKPMENGTVILTKRFLKRTLDTLQTIVADKNGNYKMEFPELGYIELLFSGSSNKTKKIPLLLENEKTIKLDVQIDSIDNMSSGIVKFGKNNEFETRFFRYCCLNQEILDDINQKQDKAMASGMNSKEFYDNLDLDPYYKQIESFNENEKLNILKQYLGLIKIETAVSGWKYSDSLLSEKLIKEIPTNSPVWDIKIYYLGNCIYSVIDPDYYIDQVIENYPSRDIRIATTWFALIKYDTDKNVIERNKYYNVMINKFEDTKDAEISGKLFSPDKQISIGKQLPPFSFNLLSQNGKIITNEMLKGKYFLLDFWGIWCVPCVESIPGLQRVYENYKDKNFEILSLSYDESPEALHDFQKNKYAMPWLNVFMTDEKKKEVEDIFEIYSFPTLILVDPNGKIVATTDELSGEQLEKTLEKYLK